MHQRLLQLGWGVWVCQLKHNKQQDNEEHFQTRARSDTSRWAAAADVLLSWPTGTQGQSRHQLNALNALNSSSRVGMGACSKGHYNLCGARMLCSSVCMLRSWSVSAGLVSKPASGSGLGHIQKQAMALCRSLGAGAIQAP